MEVISINLKKKKYSVDVNSIVHKISGAYKNTVIDKNSVVCKSSEKTVDENSVVAQFSGVDYFTWSRHYIWRVRSFCWTFCKWNHSARADSGVFGRALFLDFLTLFNVLRVFGQYTSLSRQKKKKDSLLFLAYKCVNFGLVLPIKTCEIWFKMYKICINAMEELWKKLNPFKHLKNPVKNKVRTFFFHYLWPPDFLCGVCFTCKTK